MSTIDRLTELFERFPGIGPRQARRFVFHLLTEPKPELERLASLIASVKDSVYECPECFRFHTYHDTARRCEICADTTRDRSLMMVVERDSDVRPVERSGTFKGLFFVLGGTVPLMSEGETKRLRGGALKAIVEQRRNDTEQPLREVILAFGVNPDGENTARYIETLLSEHKEAGLIITTLGRGLSTGSELEYADPETVKNALRNRA
jgi:recombination protein RecR